MKTLSFKAMIAMLFLLGSFACEKDLPPPALNDAVIDEPQNRTLTFRKNELNEHDTIMQLTVLGNPKTSNPYHIDTMTKAYNLLYQQNVSTLPVTHKYVKFTPATVDEVIKLHNSDLILVDFPLHYEIVEMGDYYLPHGAPFETTIPEYYTVVENDVVLPPITHTEIDELVLAPYTSLLTYVAFYLSGEEHEGLPGIGTPNVYNTHPEECEETCPPDFLCCLFEGISCDGPMPDYCFLVSAECNPWTGALWPDCLDLNDDGDDTAPNPLTEGCECAASYPTRHPAGCIRVEDTELPDNTLVDGQPRHMEGVNNVKVIWWDGGFRLKRTTTDENGCWHIDHREKGKAYMWVIFANDLLHIRSGLGNTWNIAYLLAPIIDFAGQFGGGTYNNIEVNYLMWGINNNGTRAHRRWGAANIMNALPDYRDKASADNINLPPQDLDIFLNMSDELIGFDLTSNAPMFDHLTGSQVVSILSGGFIDLGFENILGLGEDLLWDMFINVNTRGSDRLYETLYHEFAHTSHFDQVGGDYWVNLMVAEVLNGGWGDAGDIGADRISLCESWASHIGWTYAHDRYGTNNSLTQDPTWLERLENTKNDRLDHVPVGLYHDLMDTAIDMGNICDDGGGDCQPVADNVNSLTNADMFALLNTFITSVDAFEAAVQATLVPGSGNANQDVEDLFDSY